MTLSHGVTVAGWIAIAAAVIAVSITRRIPSAAAVLRAAARSLPARAVLLLAWAWLGWHFFVRTSR